MTRRTSTTVPEVTGYRRMAKLKNLISKKIIIFDMILWISGICHLIFNIIASAKVLIIHDDGMGGMQCWEQAMKVRECFLSRLGTTPKQGNKGVTKIQDLKIAIFEL